ncbi:hypothetical protein [Gallaecimonas mangrovi]|uniref:hypothetical protein n=1 Tax=Gallaecimonas mangrovi TaxID=2291597 RepID=UPI000E20B3D5|nr:hypothetical protein [Gallaecimonas mangrovi]
MRRQKLLPLSLRGHGRSALTLIKARRMPAFRVQQWQQLQHRLPEKEQLQLALWLRAAIAQQHLALKGWLWLVLLAVMVLTGAVIGYVDGHQQGLRDWLLLVPSLVAVSLVFWLPAVKRQRMTRHLDQLLAKAD